MPILCSDIHTLILLWLLLPGRRKHFKGPLLLNCIMVGNGDEDLGGMVSEDNHLWWLRPLISFLKAVAYLLWEWRERCMTVASVLVWMNCITAFKCECNVNTRHLSRSSYGQMLVSVHSNVSTSVDEQIGSTLHNLRTQVKFSHINNTTNQTILLLF